MVLLYTPPKQKHATTRLRTEILDLDYQGLGVAKIQGKTWFIENALPQEIVEVQTIEEKRQYGRGIAQKILKASAQRQSPPCEVYHRCGGCQMQHLPIDLQRQTKQNALVKRLAKLQPDVQVMPMITSDAWHYRRRVRLSMWLNPKTKQLDIGFRQKHSQQIVNIQQCEVLEPQLNQLLPALTALFRQWSSPQKLGHLELVQADNGTAVLLRHLGSLAEIDRTLLLNFATKHQLMLFLQQEDAIVQIYGEPPYYQLEPGLTLQFDIRDFIQVNTTLNQKMVKTALDWLELTPQDHVLDLFCGMGNFTLPLSRFVNQVIGIEGVEEMVHKAKKNATLNQCHNVQFYQANLEQGFVDQPWAKNAFNKILLDPPRAGAAFALQALCDLQAQKILYVSCHPATLVRDTEILVQAGYALKKVAMIDMFPQTGHLESISLFEKE
ncbi:23S rRNA (uracil(1939)-C(5))-methyltransferase RlmD [Pasteurella sp. PK-2025]|uniref:23S rRNA (uracil(1939)-C(5))-methyltransferase RlmD n=1 Tax=unclassified Pasteurella TaxID=2621516 RepID=UPI003C707823